VHALGHGEDGTWDDDDDASLPRPGEIEIGVFHKPLRISRMPGRQRLWQDSAMPFTRRRAAGH
jgi:hypothetical protein